MQFKDYYATLGVKPDVSDADLKSAYRRLARKYHPDVSKEGDAEEKFKAVNEAYEALKDPARRKAYDQLRAGGYRAGDEFQGPPPNWQRERDVDFGEAGGNEDFSDFFESLFGRMGGAASISRPPIAAAASASACATAPATARSTSRFPQVCSRARRSVWPGKATRAQTVGPPAICCWKSAFATTAALRSTAAMCC